MSQTGSKSVFRPSMPAESPDFFQRIDMFFAGKGPVHQTMRLLVKRLEKAQVPYAILGGMAVNAHRHDERMTKDVDVLLTREGLDKFRQLFVPKYYEPVSGRGRRFVDRKNQFLGHLHPSVHQDFIECLEEKRREHEYLAREEE